MNLTIFPARLRGSVTPPPSKSLTHRYLIAAMLAGGRGTLENLAEGADIDATRRCLTALFEDEAELPLLDCGASGSTLRFLMPLALLLRRGARFTGTARLMERPLAPYLRLFGEKGIAVLREGAVLTLRGDLPAGEYRVAADVSSQFFTGLLFALPLLEAPSTLLFEGQPVSESYLALTNDVLQACDVWVQQTEDGFFVPGRQHYVPPQARIESDWSAAAVYVTANRLGSDVSILGLNRNSLQGDKKIEILLGQEIADVSDCPDLVPLLALHAALQKGKTTQIVRAGRLRGKESDRLETTAAALGALGARVDVTADGLAIEGVETLCGGTIDACGDHRIAMLAALAATVATAAVTIEGAQCVAKSYPRFWEDYTALGGQIREAGR